MNESSAPGGSPVPGTTCCMCHNPATWVYYDSYSIPRNTYCDEHRPELREVPC